MLLESHSFEQQFQNSVTSTNRNAYLFIVRAAALLEFRVKVHIPFNVSPRQC